MNRIFAYSLFLLVLTGCAGLNTMKVSPERFAEFRPEVIQERTLKTGSTLVFSVEIAGETELSNCRATINHAGFVTVPLAGDLQMAGRTPSDARQTLKKAYSRFYVSEPLIIMTLDGGRDQEAWGTVTILGNIKNPGSVTLAASSLRLSEVIQKAGGFAPSARQDAVHVSRLLENGKKIQCVIDFRDIGKLGQSDADLELFAGDVVYIPERIF